MVAGTDTGPSGAALPDGGASGSPGATRPATVGASWPSGGGPGLIVGLLLIALWGVTPARASDHAASRDGPGFEVQAAGTRRSRALVIALHGGSWRGTPPQERARRLAADLDREARRAGLRVLAPTIPDGPGGAVAWLTAEGERRVLALIDGELAAGRVDRDRIHLAGHGAGATGALVLASRHPRRFAAVAVWSGTPPPLWDAERRVVGLRPDPVPGLAGVPVHLWTGEQDPVLDRAALRHFVDAMTAAGASHELAWVQGEGGHDLGGRPGVRAGLRFLAERRRVELSQGTTKPRADGERGSAAGPADTSLSGSSPRHRRR